MWRTRSLSGNKAPASETATYLTRGPRIALALAGLGWCLLALLTCTTFLGSSAPRRNAVVDEVSSSLVVQFPASATVGFTQRGMEAWPHPTSSPGSASSSAVRTLDWAASAVTLSQDRGSDSATNTQPANGPLVRIHHRQGSSAGKEAAMRIAREVRKVGGDIISISAEPAVPTTRQVRYSSHTDAAEANELVQRFKRRWGNTWRIDRSENAIGDRRFEIWLPHR